MVRQGSPILIPPGIGEVHHEVELGVVIGRTAAQVPAEEARACIGGYVLALDMTARELQAAAKAEGQPWTRSKCYDTFTPMSEVVPAEAVADDGDLELWLAVDGEERQRGSTRDMIFSVPELIAHISQVMTLSPGDVIITGTPEGVGPVAAGQTISCGMGGGLADMSFPVLDRPAHK